MKKVSELIIHILLMAVIDGLLIYKEFASFRGYTIDSYYN